MKVLIVIFIEIFFVNTFLVLGQKSIQWDNLNLEKSQGALLQKTTALTNNALKFVLNEEISQLEIETDGLYKLKGSNEHSIRPPAQTVMALGIALSFDIYDEKIVGLPRIEAEKIQINLIKTLLKAHQANGGNWGNCWQCAHWAFYTGFGAWVSLDLLGIETREQLKNVILAESDNFNKEPPYCNNCTNDTKAEENAWNANILSLALAIMPNHKNAEWWKERASQWILSAYARESDLERDIKIDGKLINEWISGWNMHEDGYVYNHGRIHPDYTAAANLNLWNPLVFTLADIENLEASYWNMDYIYKQLVEYNWQHPPYEAPGGTIYRRDSCKLFATVYYPNGTDWSVNLVDNFFMFDVQCHVMDLDQHVDIPAIKWANVRADYMLWMQARSKTGQLYTKSDNLNFPPKESKAASMFALAHLTLLLEESIGMKAEAKNGGHCAASQK